MNMKKTYYPPECDEKDILLKADILTGSTVWDASNDSFYVDEDIDAPYF